MKRVIVLLLDSFGIGASQDAPKYGDEGADTFGHIAKACANGEADQTGLRSGPLLIPNMASFGLHHAALASTGVQHSGYDPDLEPNGMFGYAVERSLGKDTPSGHWEIAGVPIMFEWGYFKKDYPSFPKELVDAFVERGNVPGILGNKAASGTDIMAALGEEHMQSGKPIVYTSGDSVFQIAAHEESFGLDRLYALCEIARELVNEYKIGRVIARPFSGDPGRFERTGNRKDYSTPPPAPTLLDGLKAQGREVIAIGKTGDIFAHTGTTSEVKVTGNMNIFDETLNALKTASDGSLIFSNFVDFDSHYGHRRDVIGYANALEQFDKRIPELLEMMAEDDIAIISADHGCDPTRPGSDHTREHIPIVVFGKNVEAKFIGRRESFADIGQSIASYLSIAPLDYGVTFL